MNKDENIWQKFGSFLDILSKIAAIAAAWLALQINYSNKDIERKLKDLESIKKTVEINQDSLSFDRDFKFRIYELTVNAIKSKDLDQQQAAYVAVNTMMNDKVFKAGLLGLFVKSNTVVPEIQKAATVAKFDVVEAKKARPVYSPTNKIYVDIIYLADAASAKSVARKIYDALNSSDSYVVGLKAISRERSQSPGYGINSNQIRFDSSEKAKAEKLMEVVNQILPEGTQPFTIRQINNNRPTKDYVSLFVIA